jgi:hypothetical protein
MQDNRLGRPVDVGEYTGPLLNGKPIHSGHCSDGVDGCGRCRSAAREFGPIELAILGFPTTETCDLCKKAVPYADAATIRDYEDDTTSIACSVCRARRAAAMEAEEHKRSYPEMEW